jgi:hypothetical protein
MALPKFQSDDQAFSLLQTNWKIQLDPVIALPLSSSIILEDLNLFTGKNVIDHKLGRNLQGWIVTHQSGFSQFYDNQAANPLPDKNLWLYASSGVNVNLMVF